MTPSHLFLHTYHNKMVYDRTPYKLMMNYHSTVGNINLTTLLLLSYYFADYDWDRTPRSVTRLKIKESIGLSIIRVIIQLMSQ